MGQEDHEVKVKLHYKARPSVEKLGITEDRMAVQTVKKKGTMYIAFVLSPFFPPSLHPPYPPLLSFFLAGREQDLSI